MTRRPRRLAPLALLALAALSGCQDYNFSPVNQCLIQPGTERVTLSDISTADILFVVDDSGSMGGEQQSLAASFDAFVENLKATNLTRVQNGLEPIDFHIAITTTSVFINWTPPNGATCQSSCGGKAAQVCCVNNAYPLTAMRSCQADTDCTAPGGPWTCMDVSQRLAPEKACVDGAGKVLEEPVACPVVGQGCGQLQVRYQYTHGPRSCSDRVKDCRAPYDAACRTGCTGAPATGTFCCDATGNVDPLQCNPGISAGEYTPYPRGDFVQALDATAPVGTKPRVIHFEKNLFCTRDANGCVCTHVGSPTVCDPPVVNDVELDKRIDWFKANVMVGTCGSGQEQGLEAARRAVKKALRQDGMSQPADVAAGEWPHAKSKLVTVWVGDEDDCSSPEDASQGVIFSPYAEPPYADSCEADGGRPVDQQKRYSLDEYSSFFTGLGVPLATGFIASATGMPPPPDTNRNNCVDSSCQPDKCVDPSCTSGSLLCGGQAKASRYIEMATTFTTTGADVVVGSICAGASDGTLTTPATAPTPANFSSILDRVAEVVKQPSGLQLPTQPATAALTILRIVGTNGSTRKTCTGPAQAGTTGAALNDYDWWFIDPNDATDPNGQKPTGASRNIQINRDVLRCTANPGETYSADYLGLVPSGGCDPDDLDPIYGQPRACIDSLGVGTAPWVCQREAGASRGSCLCGG
jgi:hypothetical protein